MAIDLLTANGPPGAWPRSWYAATADLPLPHPALEGEVRADVCIVGGGYTGLSAALHLISSISSADRPHQVLALKLLAKLCRFRKASNTPD
mgnify:CR=1 FL=1